MIGGRTSAGAGLALLAGALALAGCATLSPAQRRAAAAPAHTALQESRFADAERLADQLLVADRRNPQANAVRAIARYKATMHQLWGDLSTIAIGAFRGSINHRYLRQSCEQAELALAGVDADLAIVEADRDFSLDLCLACWKVDWNRNGTVDGGDEHLLEVELDGAGERLGDDDPRRRPSFRFDTGDAAWARAMVSFQRALLQLVLAYRWSDLDKLLPHLLRGLPPPITIRIESASRVANARQLLLHGLADADRARREYLAETDDEREWVPNPRQRSHPLPLPVDEALFATWRDVVGDLTRLVRGEEGIDVTEAAQLGDHQWEAPPRGVLDVGGMLAAPKDIQLDFAALKRAKEAPDAALASVFGDHYRVDMKRSPLLQRLARMKAEMKRGEESFERKLRYLFWLN